MRLFALLFLFAGLITSPLMAQEEMEEEEMEEEEVETVTSNYFYVNGGSFYLGSDISGSSFTGWTAGIGYQTYFSTPLFLRVGLVYGQDQDVDDILIGSKQYGLNQTLQDLGYSSFVRNYSTSIFGLQAKLGLEFVNIVSDEGRKTFSLYLVGGPELYYVNAKYDALDGNGNLYDFSSINFDADDADDQVKDLLDGEYETDAPESQRLGFALSGGLGFRLLLSDSFGLGLEHQTGLTFTDATDGYVSDDDNDSINFTRLFVYFTL